MTPGPCGILLARAEWNGMVIERFCGKPGGRYVNGYFCPEHAAVLPFPDAAATAVALAERGVPDTAPREYGEPEGDRQIEVAKIRVLKAHKDAVLEQMETAAAVINAVGMDGFAESMAAAVLSADDGSTRYVVGVRIPGYAPMIFGPYVTRAAAEKAIRTGHIPKYAADSTAYVLPITAAPKAEKKKAAPKKA